MDEVRRLIVVGNEYHNKYITECGALQLKFLLKNAFRCTLLLMPLSSLEHKILKKRMSIINIMRYIWEKKSFDNFLLFSISD